ncbi:MAG: hypothetical protein F6J86_39380, partial [Symploca sp. SIO1B1]|nr:hypothetical protein [Symploca sp. SIO1B1]
MQTNSLDKIIREIDTKTVDAKNKSRFPEEEIVIIDRETWQAVPNKSWSWFRNLAFYLVSNTDNPTNVAERQARPYYLTNFATGQKLGVSITYWASCDPGNEAKLVEALCRGKTPGDALDKKVEKWIADFTKNDASIFLENYPVQLARLREHVRIKLKEEVGVNLELKLSLEKEPQLEPFSIPAFPLEVYVSDCDEPLELQVQTELVVDDNNKVKAIFHDVNDAQEWQELVKLFKSEIKKYLLQYINIDQFSYELKDTVRNQLVVYLDKIMVNYGRRVGFLYLESNAVPSAKQLVPVKCKVECEVQKYSEPIYVENTLLMLPLNTARYKPNQASKLETWVEGKLEKIIKPLLLKKTYVSVLLDFEPIATEIRDLMEDEAKSIGYEIQQIVSVPDLEHQELKENFKVTFEEESFATRDVNVKVLLGVSVTARIRDFTKIEDYLKPKADIKKLIRRTVHSVTGQVLATVEPERYYMRFNHPGVDEQGKPLEDKSVEQELIEAVEQELAKQFNAQVSRITADVYDTDIAKHFKKLYGTIGSFEVEIASIADIEEAVTYKGDFQIEGVEANSWYTFQARKPEMSDISRSITRRLDAKLSVFTKEDLQFTDLEYLSLLENLINKLARECVVDQFGLEIIMTNLSRSRTQQEKLLAEEISQQREAKK